LSVDLIKTGGEIVAIASVAHTLLPPWEVFNDYPTFQKAYKLFVFIVGYVALNGRSTIHPSISTASGTKPSEVVVKSNGVNAKETPA
jgi:hypothetical protein